jgi:protein SCO1/2
MIRTPIALVPYIVLATVIFTAALWQAGDEMASRQRTVGIADVGGPFVLTDQDGAARTQADYRGRYMLIYFGYTYCPDVCPLSLGVMNDALDKMGSKARAVTPIFITVDPARDTPKVLKTYVAAFGKNWVGLTGDAAAIATVTKEYRVYFKRQPLKDGGYAMDHSSTIYLMGPDGRFITHYDESMGPDALAQDLKKRV